jgi:starch phosphorylase
MHSLYVERALPEPLAPLRALSRNLWWTWNTGAAALFGRIDAAAWHQGGHNPVRLLQVVQESRLNELANDSGFLLQLSQTHEAFESYLQRPPRLSVPGIDPRSDVVAYFSLEFALTESLPSYSGGLGVLAGDHLKSASDLGLPLVGVGLLYSEGYFQQVLGPDGWQHEEYSPLDVAAQPLERVRDAGGQELRIAVPFDGRDVLAAVWRLDVGQTPLFLLDSNVEENRPTDRAITARLYGGDGDTRIQQEMLLGIGGVRALRALGIRPAVCHMNEGHSALLGVDRIRMLMEESGATFDEARLPVAAATVFTTHTAVAAGIDLFSPELVSRHLGHYHSAMGLDARSFIGLGRTHPDNEDEPFSMALLGLRLSNFRNGVSLAHRGVSRRLWESAWPQLPEEQVPITSITNGVHLPTWVAHDIADLFDRHLGPIWRDDPTREDAWARVAAIPDEELWRAHERQRERLVGRARAAFREATARRGLAWGGPQSSGLPLDPGALTIGFARRFAGYKRATLLFRDPERLAAIVNHPQRPVQFVFAGKAHPRDEPGKQLIREVVHHSRLPEFRDRLVVLERYDLDLARSLVQGCDAWLNTPLRPLEASGTSGMKAVANGALHLSVLDGWWAEAYRDGLGWAVGGTRMDEDPEVQDAFDADSLYDLLENEVVPAFYTRDADGVPTDWVRRMKASVAEYARRFNTTRMVEEYARQAYGPAATAWNRLRTGNLQPARDLARWLEQVRLGWDGVKVLSVESAPTHEGQGAPLGVAARIITGQLRAEDLAVDLVSGPGHADGTADLVTCSRMALHSTGEDGAHEYRADLEPEQGGRLGYAIRITPSHPDLIEPLSTGLIQWA